MKKWIDVLLMYSLGYERNKIIENESHRYGSKSIVKCEKPLNLDPNYVKAI